ncbi:hypothetical protein VNI00_012999 [Paramarasmius palmivorus]|uniref:Glucanase n=1 Tax=Paramarasmius palmivorus TaxID=297713 RepID=A0AAW0BZ92_9AGAR
MARLWTLRVVLYPNVNLGSKQALCGIRCTYMSPRTDYVCDSDGCDFNSYRLGNTSFLGPGEDKVVDTNRKVTVVTQFLTSEKDEGALREIRRMYIQDGRIIHNSHAFEQYDSITDEFCAAQKEVFGNGSPNDLGGLAAIGEAFKRGMVLTMSIWDDFDRETGTGWMDGVFPADGDLSKPGVVRGPCVYQGGGKYIDGSVVFSDIRVGPIGSTYGHLVD